MRRILTLAACGFLVAASAGWLAAGGRAPGPRDVTHKEVGAMMKKVHDGKDVPLARTAAELKKEAPDWEALAKDAKAFTDMAELLQQLPKYTSDIAYTDGAAGLAKAAKAKDRKAATEAFAGLRKSCSACHYGNPVRPGR